MNEDWQEEIARIYDFLGVDLAPQLLDRMRAYLAGERRHLGHRYSLEEFGLGPAIDVNESMTAASGALGSSLRA